MDNNGILKYAANIMHTIEFIKNNRSFFPNEEVFVHVLTRYENIQAELFDKINVFFLR